MIEYITWKLGGVMPYYGDTIDSFYSDDRGTEVYIGNTTAKYDGYIGLMYPSDYGYAAPESSCPRTMNYENYGSSSCYDQNWLYLNGLTQWTLTHHRYWDYDVFVVSHTGYINTSDYGVAWSGGYVRPSLYLKSDTGFTSGNGSIDDPYIIN